MEIFTMGFTKKNAEVFFDLIISYNIDLLIDIRLNNSSQLAGFTKGRDLEYFLKKIGNCSYVHESDFAPTKEILNDYKNKKINWEEYEKRYIQLMDKRDIKEIFKTKYLNMNKVLLLCSEPTADKCHRRLLADILKEINGDINVSHI